MKSKRLNFYIILFLTIIIFGNSFFIIESSAGGSTYFDYKNPTTTPLWSYSLGKQFVSAVDISSDGTYIIAACDNMISDIRDPEEGILYLFDNSISKTKNPLWNYSILNSFSSVAISANGSYLIAGGGYSDRRVYLFNNSDPTPQWTYNTGSWVYDVEITDDGCYAAAASGSRQAFFFNKTKPTPIWNKFLGGLALRAALSSNGSYMAVTDNAAKLYFFNTSRTSPDWTYTLSGDMSTALSISEDGNYIASGGDKIYVFKKNSSIPIWTYETPHYIGSIKLSPDGNYIVASAMHGNKMYLFNRLNSTPLWTYSTKEPIDAVDISFNGDYIVARDYAYVYLFNKSSSTPIWRYRLDQLYSTSYDYGLGISSDGKYIVVAGRHKIYLFDRDIVSAPTINIPEFQLFIMFLIIGIILLISVIAVFLNHRKKQRSTSDFIESPVILFGFELNRTQTTYILLLSLIGVFMVSHQLVSEISYNLFQSIFVTLPIYLAEPEPYHDLYLYYNFAPVITRIIVYSIFLFLSVYSLRKVLKKDLNSRDIKNKRKRKTIPQDRIVNWLGLKLSHGQSLFIFGLSLVGILFAIQLYIDSTTFFSGILEELSMVPTGPYSATGHVKLEECIPIVITVVFIVLCLYSIIVSRRGKPIIPSRKVVKNYGIILFIISFIVFFFTLLRFFSHLFLFTDLAYTLGTTPNASNPYQSRDFLLVLVILIICLILMTSSYFLKESPDEDTKIQNNITWLHIKLTPKRAIILLSLAILGITYFGYIFLVIFFMMGSYLFGYFHVVTFFTLMIPCIFVIFISYAISKVVKKHRLNKFIDAIENSEEITCHWFKFNLNRLYSVIFFSLSIGFSIFYIFNLILLNLDARLVISGISIPSSISRFDELLWILRFIILISFNSVLLAVSIYTIKRTSNSIKSNK